MAGSVSLLWWPAQCPHSATPAADLLPSSDRTLRTQEGGLSRLVPSKARRRTQSTEGRESLDGTSSNHDYQEPMGRGESTELQRLSDVKEHEVGCWLVQA